MDYVVEAAAIVKEVMPWDLDREIKDGSSPIMLDIREPNEFNSIHIENSLNVPRGILEVACEWDYEETIPELVNARDKEIVTICRSGYRSILSAKILIEIGYSKVRSLKTGLRGWNDYELPLMSREGKKMIPVSNADKYFVPKLRKDQLKPKV